MSDQQKFNTKLEGLRQNLVSAHMNLIASKIPSDELMGINSAYTMAQVKILQHQQIIKEEEAVCETVSKIRDDLIKDGKAILEKAEKQLAKARAEFDAELNKD